MPRLSYEEQLTAELIANLDGDVAWLTANLLENGRSPWSKRISEQERLDFFMDQFWRAPGQPNEPGRAWVMEKYGVRTYARIALAVGAAGGSAALSDVEIPEDRYAAYAEAQNPFTS